MVEYITIYTINLLNFENTYPYFFKIKICYVDIHRFVLKLNKWTRLVYYTYEGELCAMCTWREITICNYKLKNTS